jgi:hypothetical protein
MLEIETLTDGGQQPLDVAQRVADFVAGAEESLDVAQYDFHLGEETAALVGGALREGRSAGRPAAASPSASSTTSTTGTRSPSRRHRSPTPC